MQKNCFVALSVRNAISPLIISIVNLIMQLEKMDPQTKIANIEIGGPGQKINVTLSDKSSDLSFQETDFKFEGNAIEAVLLKEMNVSVLSRILAKVNQALITLNMRQKNGIITDFLINEDKLIIKTSVQVADVVKEQPHVIPIRTEKLLLIDGSNLLSKGYFATSYGGGTLMQTSDGRYTNAVYSMVQSFFGLLKRHKPTHVAVLWDESRDKTWRRAMYPPYKALREGADPELKEQYGTTKEMLNKMNVPQLMMPTLEADDLIGTLSKKWIEEKEGEVFIVSSDKDMHQLLNDRTTQLLLNNGKETQFTESAFQEKYGIEPQQWIDAKALLGEKGKTSDNIPGCAGVGEKAVFPLLQKFGSLENIYNDLSQLEPDFKRYISKLEAGKEDVDLTKKLATILRDVKGVIETWDDLLIKMSKKGTSEAFRDLEFDSLLEKIS